MLPPRSVFCPITVQLLLGRAEAKELRQQLAAQEESADKLRVSGVVMLFWQAPGLCWGALP